jgi:transposase
MGAATRIFVATGVTDMRFGFNGLYALAAGQLQQDPQSGHQQTKRSDEDTFL